MPSSFLRKAIILFAWWEWRRAPCCLAGWIMSGVENVGLIPGCDTPRKERRILRQIVSVHYGTRASKRRQDRETDSCGEDTHPSPTGKEKKIKCFSSVLLLWRWKVVGYFSAHADSESCGRRDHISLTRDSALKTSIDFIPLDSLKVYKRRNHDFWGIIWASLYTLRSYSSD